MQVKLNFPPQVVEDYVKKWAAVNAKKEGAGEAEKAMLKDIVTMVGVARSVMQVAPGKNPGK